MIDVRLGWPAKPLYWAYGSPQCCNCAAGNASTNGTSSGFAQGHTGRVAIARSLMHALAKGAPGRAPAQTVDRTLTPRPRQKHSVIRRGFVNGNGMLEETHVLNAIPVGKS